MAVAKVIEVLAESEQSWEDAAQNAIDEVSDSVRNVKHLYVEGMQALVEGERIKTYRLNAKVTFVVEGT